MELTDAIIDAHRNTGGFDMIGSGRTKLETDEQFEAARRHCEALGISALVIIGGDDSNTNACMLAEYFKSHNIPIQVIGCPKTSICPSVGVSNRLRQRSRVLFPVPEGPMMEITSPLRITALTSFRGVALANTFFK